ncbi:MAG: DUF3365 domain-containing protein [Chitinophagaceae bacterium]|nr:DUF3365 domain-containing protein [Chitinophagaceae bacterium]
MRYGYLFILALLIGMASCSERSVQLTDEQKEEYLSLGNDIASQSQKALLAKVTQAIADSGITGAVAFCSENAIPITESLSKEFSIEIKRVSDRNRNPDNALLTDTDLTAMSLISLMMEEDNGSEPFSKHVALQENNYLYYYKAIPLGMPTCLNCHGNKDTDIASETLKLIEKKYPNDKATGYQLGELRGLWKIAFPLDDKSKLD